MQAKAWWSDLDQYIACQAIADATRLWPPQNALDHGKAGLFHLAARLDVMNSYIEAYFDQPSWITSAGLTRLGELKVVLTGSRAPGSRADAGRACYCWN